MTVQEKEIAAQKRKEQEEHAKVRADERRRETIRVRLWQAIWVINSLYVLL